MNIQMCIVEMCVVKINAMFDLRYGFFLHCDKFREPTLYTLPLQYRKTIIPISKLMIFL